MKTPPARARNRPASGSAIQWEMVSSSPRQTDQIGRIIGEVVQGGDRLALHGDLGAGKTALIRGIAAGLGAPAQSVSSPTFTLVHEYRGRLRLVHADLYRLRSERDVESIGLDDYIGQSAVMVVEWAERSPALLRGDRLDVELTHRTPKSRTIRFRATGPSSLRLLADLTARLAPAPRPSLHRPRKASKART